MLRWIITLLGILALAALIWFVGPLVSVAGIEPLASPLSRIVAILVLVVVWLVVSLVRQLRANRAGDQIVEGMAAQEAPPAAAAGPSDHELSAEEVAVLRERFREAMAVLKESRRKRGGQSLYDLPWYVIIGPPGSGKTTALINSGLEFPLSDRFGKEALRGVGGTRDCDWWFTNEAVLLDTAGRYVTQDSHAAADSAAWSGFLDLLKRHRRQRPLNGVLVAMSLSDLIVCSEREREAHVRAIRRRIAEVRKQLGIELPVYMVFTKCDLIAGFMEFFDDLRRDDRRQVWGMTFPHGDRTQAPVARFGAEFDALLTRLNERLLARMDHERDILRRSMIYEFPQEMATLKEALDEFLRGVFGASRYEDQALLRGVYFTSGTQEGTPIDRMMGSLARTFGLDATSLPAFSGQGRSYFITDLLREVIFAEQGLAGSDRRFQRQRTWLQRSAYALALLAAVGAGIAWSTSFTRNQGYLGQVQQRLDDYAKVARPAPGNDFAKIVPRLDALRDIGRVFEPFAEGVPWLSGLGLYQGTKIGQAAHRAYLRELNATLAPALAARLAAQLQGTDDPDFLYQGLKTYLMLGDLEHFDAEQIKLWFSVDWQRRYGDDATLRGHLQTHLDSLLGEGFEPVALDEGVISNVRLALNQVPLAQLVYGRLKRESMADDKYPFRIADVVGRDGQRVFTRASGKGLADGIPGLFTYRGFYEGFLKQSKPMVARVRKERWVLGKGKDELSRAELDQLDSDIMALYSAEYMRRWDALLDDLRIVSISSVRQGIQILDILSGSNSPLRRLLKAVARNTDLTRLPPALAKLAQSKQKAAKKGRLARLFSSAGEDQPAAPASQIPGAAVARHYQRLNQLVQVEGGGAPPIDRLLDLLSQLYGQMSSAAEAGAEGAAGASAAGRGVLRRVRVEAARQPQPVKRWLLALAGKSEAATSARIRSSVRKRIAAAWASRVVPQCRKVLVDRYPVYANSRREMTLEDFGRFFGPGGTIDGFFKEVIKPYVDTTVEPWRWKRAGGVRLGIPNSVLREFQRAALIRDTFFDGGGKKPLVRFRLKPLAMDASIERFLMHLGTQKLTYNHGPARPTSLRWPDRSGSGRVELRVRPAPQGTRSSFTDDGPWAWFRLLARSRMQATDVPDRFKLQFTLGGRRINYELRASSAYNPFGLKALAVFRCPEKL